MLQEAIERLESKIKDLATYHITDVTISHEKDCPFNKACRYCMDSHFTLTYSDKETKTGKCYHTEPCFKDKRRRLLLAESGMIGEQEHNTFANSKTDKHNADLIKWVQTYWDRKEWLYVYSPKDDPKNPGGNGTGKSYIADAIGHMFLDQGIPVHVVRELDMASELKRTFGSDGDKEWTLMNKYRQRSVLIIQDLGKENLSKSEWWPSKLFDIIDYRYTKGLVTVITSNCKLGELEGRYGVENHGSAIYSRLKGKCAVKVLSGPDRRLKGV